MGVKDRNKDRINVRAATDVIFTRFKLAHPNALLC